MGVATWKKTLSKFLNPPLHTVYHKFPIARLKKIIKDDCPCALQALHHCIISAKSLIRWHATTLPYSGKLSREKTFANFVVVWLFVKVFSAKFWGMVSFGAAKVSNPRKFFSMKIVFFTNSQKFSPLKVSYYTVHTIQQQNCKYCKYSKHIC